MFRFLGGLLRAALLLLAALIVLPPLWFALFPADAPPELPPPGQSVVLPNGVAINVVETLPENPAAAAPPVLLVHGLPGTAYDWRLLSAALANQGRRVLAMDRAGYGHSAPPPAGARQYSLARNAEDVLALLDALDLQNATLVGWSYGGATAAVVAAQQPPRLGKLVLVGTGGPGSAEQEAAGPPQAPGFIRFLYSAPVMWWREQVPPFGRALINVLSQQAFSGQAMPSWWLPGVEANFARATTLQTYRGEILRFADTPASLNGKSYEDIIAPALILHGTEDRLTPIEIARYLNTRIAGSALYEYQGASHMLPVTHAHDMALRIHNFDANADASAAVNVQSAPAAAADEAVKYVGNIAPTIINPTVVETESGGSFEAAPEGGDFASASDDAFDLKLPPEDSQ